MGPRLLLEAPDCELGAGVRLRRARGVDDEAVAEHQHEEREHDQEVHEVGDDLIERQHKRREPEGRRNEIRVGCMRRHADS
mgnify:CR=1 FL=1